MFFLFSLVVRGRSTLLFHGMDPLEEKIFILVNEYRKERRLPLLKPSDNLAYVAHKHAVDFIENSPDVNGGNIHSWSDKGKWKPVKYTSDHRNAHLMWSKPLEISNYKSEGFEISYVLEPDIRNTTGVIADEVVNRWKVSPEQNNVIIQKGGWVPMKAMGVGVYKGYACIWFGQEEDIYPDPVETEKGMYKQYYFYERCYFRNVRII